MRRGNVTNHVVQGGMAIMTFTHLTLDIFKFKTLLVVGDNISCNIEMDMMQCICH